MQPVWLEFPAQLENCHGNKTAYRLANANFTVMLNTFCSSLLTDKYWLSGASLHLLQSMMHLTLSRMVSCYIHLHEKQTCRVHTYASANITAMHQRGGSAAEVRCIKHCEVCISVCI